MAQGYDGDIKLSVSLSADEVKSSAQTLSNDIKAIFSKSAGKELDSKFQRLQSAMSKAVAKSQELQSAMERLEKTEVPTDEYKEIQTQIDKASSALVKLLDRQQKFIETGGDTKSKVYQGMQYDVDQLRNTISYAEGELQELVETGKAFKLGSDTAEYENLKNQLGESNNQMRILTESASEYSQKADDAGNKTSRFSGILNGVKGILGRVGSGLKSLAQRFLHAGSSSQSFGSKLGMSFKNLLAYAVGIRSVFSLFSKLRSAISSGISDMAKLNGGINQTNAAMSQLQASLNLLRGSLAAAFTPILTVVAPILSNFIDQIASVITAIGMMIAKLTGAKSYFRATKTSANYAGGGGGSSGKSAEEKYQEAVEKAQKKYDEQVAKTQEKNAKAAAKAEEQQAKAAKKLAEQQEKANRKLADFDDLNVLNIEDMEELEEIEADVYDMPELELPDKEDFLGGGGGAGDPFGLEEVPLDDWEWNWDDLLAKAEELGRKFADILNDIFKDEALAQKIGNAIGNLINMAIAFAYGFVSRFDFLQFGRWIGTLLQEAIDTIRWDVLGTTIGEGLNGIADTIIGFFQTYNAGSIGFAMAEMFNRAVEAIVPEKIGEAVADVLKEPLIELRQFLTEANMTLAGEKFRRFFIEVFQNKVLGNETLGQTIGTTLGTVINKAVAFFLAMDVSKLVAALTKFFNDIFFSAIDTIDWPSLGELLYALTIGMLVGVFQGIADFIDTALRKINPDWADALDVEGFNYWLDENFGSWDRYVDALHNGVKTLDGMMTPVEAGLESLNGKLDEFTSGTAVNWEQALRDIQYEYQLTDDDMQTVIDLFVAQNDKVNESSEILAGYEGDWVAYKDTIKDVPAFIQPTIEQQKLLDDAIKDTGDTAQDTKDDIVDYVTISKEQMESGAQNAADYESKTVDALQGISDKSDEVVISFDTLTEQLNAELAGLTIAIDTWYQEMITTYFGYDAWLLMLQEGPLLAITDFFNTSFFVTWDEQMQLWWTEHVLIWFTAEKWQTDVYTPWITLFNTKWQSFITKWDSNLKVWWTNHVQPWFKEKIWEDEFMHIYKVAEKVGEKTRDKVDELAEETAEAVHNACDAMKMWIQEIIEMLGEAIEMANELASIAASGGGGGGSSFGGGSRVGGSSNGGGGGTRGFMPMLDIMHFEDNLGMSAFKFPELATGAVIPPNNEFLAVLGDQRNGMNIETPLATMVEAFRSVMDEYMSGSHQSATMEVDGETFARLMMPHIMDEMNRLGYNTEIIEGI